MDEATSQMSKDLFKEFTQIQQERWPAIDNLLGTADDVDKLLADIANLAVALYVERKILARQRLQGFKSFEKEKK